jgi:hypothetical protein
MATAQDVIRVAASQVGYTEGRYNWTKFSAEMYGGRYQNQPWCGVWTDWCFAQTNMLSGEPSSVYTPAGAAGYQRANRWIGRSGNPASGDVVYFDWGGSQSVSLVDHVGLVEAVAPDYILTIEGNTSAGSEGSQSNGDGCYRRKRPRSVIVGFGRPQYQPGPAPTPPPDIDWKAVRRMAAAKILNDGIGSTGTVQQGSGGRDVLLWQQALNLVGGARLVEDGSFGPATKQAAMNFQRWMGLTPDGVCGAYTRWWMTTALQNIRDGKA